jgi:hypothetical protein
MGEGAWWAWRLAEVGTGGPRRRRRAAGEEVEAGEEGSSQKDIEGCVTVKASEGVDLVVKMVADPKSALRSCEAVVKMAADPKSCVEELRGGRKVKVADPKSCEKKGAAVSPQTKLYRRSPS